MGNPLSSLSLLHEPDEIIEIRSIDPKPVISGYFRADSPAIAQEIARYPQRTFYQTMNRVKSACYAREQHEHLICLRQPDPVCEKDRQRVPPHGSRPRSR